MLILARRTKRRRWRLGLASTSLALLGAASCTGDQPTAIEVIVSSDTIVSAAIDTLEISVTRGNSRKFFRSYKLPSEAPLPGTMTFEKDDDAAFGETVLLRISGKVLATGKERVVRTARLGFLDQKTKLLRMPLRGDCLDISCPDGQTCDGSACVPNDIDIGDLPDAPNHPIDNFEFPKKTPLERVSAPSDQESFEPAISGDGRFVAFTSTASNLASGASGSQVYVRDRQEKTTVIVSVSDLGIAGTGTSTHPSISTDGRFISFTSEAPDLVPDDDNEQADVFVHDRLTGRTSMVSVSGEGRAAAGASGESSLSSSGRFVAFSSTAGDLVLGDVNGLNDVFVRDLQSGVTVRVSIGSAGENTDAESSSPVISANGRNVAFASTASNIASGGNDNNGASDVFVRDMQLGITTLISATLSGASGNGESTQPTMSADGSTIAFTTSASDIAPGGNDTRQIVLVDTSTGQRVRVSGSDIDGGDGSVSPSLSSDGRSIAFLSFITTLVSGDTNGKADIFLVKRDALSSSTGSSSPKTTRLSTRPNGGESHGICSAVVLSSNGAYAAYVSDADDLTSDDTNAMNDVFVTPIAQ